MLNAIRIKGNKTVHENQNSVHDAKVNLYYIFKVSCYFYSKYVKPSFIEPPYYERDYHNSLEGGNPQVETPRSDGFAAQKAFFDHMMKVISNVLDSHIIKVKLDGHGFLEEIPQMSFYEFFTYYMEVLDIIASERLEFTNALIQFRKIVEEQLHTNDPAIANQRIALMMYNNTHWTMRN
jgi:hypothetical protein